ncbi:MAG: U32 family peptidase [Clostridia bacterium]|nr:U32 family peptidase [Clostridia bacterium]
MNRKLELLSPAGDMACLEAALRFGADAVYVGGPRLQLRAGTAGFSMDELARAARAAHALGKRLYVAVNAFPTNREIDALGDYAQALQAAGADAAIVADLGAVATMRRCAPGLPVHISTQANCLNYAAARAYHDMGASRVVLAREMTLNEIAELRQKTPPALELEAFIHGAMCMAWSGRCMISAYLTGRSANRGACAQSCRWKYRLEEEKRPGEYFPVEEDAGGMTILSSFDLNCIDFLDRIIDAGVISFKIEGRMKTPYYVATVTNAYRRRLDGILSGDESMLPALRRELDAVSHRAYASGFYFGEMKRHAPEDGHYLQDCQFVGTVLQRLPGGRVRVELRNRFAAGANLEVLSPHTLGLSFTARNLTDPDGTPLESASVPMSLYDLDAPEAVEPGDMLRLRLDTPS